MAIDLGEAESFIEDWYLRAGVRDPDVVMLPGELIRMRFGEESVVLVPHLKERASVCEIDGSPIYAVRSSLSRLARRHSLGHEMGHTACKDNGYSGEDLERVCDYVGAGIQTRRGPFLKRAKQIGPDFAQLAKEFGTTETWAALRYGEVTSEPIAVVAPKAIRVRGANWEWGSPENVRSAAKHGARGIVSVRLTDDSQRVALLASVA